MPELNLDRLHRKPISHINLSNYGSSTIIKCAEHIMTNDSMRNTANGKYKHETFFKQMTNLQ